VSNKVSQQGREPYDVVFSFAAKLAWHGIEMLEEQLELFGLELRSLDAQQMMDLMECYCEEAVAWKLFQAHADAASAFARRQALRASDHAGREEV
jgi:hypothetical protein